MTPGSREARPACLETEQRSSRRGTPGGQSSSGIEGRAMKAVADLVEAILASSSTVKTFGHESRGNRCARRAVLSMRPKL